jgi:hypothetical protein
VVIPTVLQDPLVHLASALGLGLLLGAAALHKLQDGQNFSRVLDDYGIALGKALPLWLRPLLRRLLPWLEITAVMGLLLSFWIPWAAMGAAILIGFYALVLAISLARGAVIEDCGCNFGGDHQTLSRALVWRNLLLLLPVLNLMAPMRDRPLVWLDAVTLGLLLPSFAALYILTNLLISNRVSLRAL